MVATVNPPGISMIRIINFICLLAAIAIVIILPFKKEIWYDETVTILCSKGISNESPATFPEARSISSNTVRELNTAQNVFKATVIDNGNSFLYNIGLHWFSLLFGNSIGVYMLFSKLCAIAALLAFFQLCKLIFNGNFFTSVAILLFATDAGFLSMSHEIRAYSLGIFFVTLAAIYFFRFLSGRETPFTLFLLGLFSVAAILTHYLSVYVIFVFLAVLVFRKFKTLFGIKNIIALSLPIGLLSLYFFLSYSGLKTMTTQSEHIQEKFTNLHFSIYEVVFRSMKILAINFKVFFPAFRDNISLFIASFLFVLALYFAGIKAARSREERMHLHTLFLLGAFSSLFLLALSIRSQHYVSLYFRYYSFGLPFSSLFAARLLCILFGNERVSKVVKYGLTAVILIPVFIYLVIHTRHEDATVKYNHVAVANEIVKYKATTVDVPRWRDAFLLHSVLPGDYNLTYFRTDGSSDFDLHTGGNTVTIPVIRQDR